MTMRAPRARLVSMALGALVVAARSADGQAVRVRSSTTARYVQLQPIRYDTAAGIFLPLPVTYAAPITQDVELSVWGLGVPGLRAYALLRGRAALGSELVWPRSDDRFDALVAFVELERPLYRIRAGRQHRASGLGWYAFDGVTATWRPRPTVRTEWYGGRGFTRGFLEPLGSEALRSLDPLRPEQSTILLGASLWAAPTSASAVTAIYQREILSDRSGLVSERAAIDARIGVGSRLVLTAAADADLALETWGRARASALVRLGRRSFLEIEGFRYKPLLDLTTIWGVFSPEAHRGVAVSARLAPTRSVALSTSYIYRRYEPLTRGTPFLLDVDDEARQLTAGARYALGDVVVDGAYRLQFGFGGAQSGGDAALAWAPPDGWRVGLRGTAFQQEEAFRVADGTVYGVGLDASGRLGDRARLRAELMRYLHRPTEGQSAVNWSQTRALLGFEFWIGANPDRPGAYR